MSYVIASPEYVAAAATDLANIGSAITDANSAALVPASSVLPAGADEVSASIASLFESHAEIYQALSAAAQAFHNQFVQLMSGGAEQYAVTEATNATPLQTVQNLLSGGGAPGQSLQAAQPLLGVAASVASAAAGVPGSLTGVAGGSAPAASTAPLATAIPPVTAAPAAFASTTTAAAAVPTETPVTPLQPPTPAYAPAGLGPALALTPLSGTPAGALSIVSAEASELSPAAVSPLAATPIAAAPQASSAAYTPATSPYSPATGGSTEASRQQSGAPAEQVEMPAYSA